MLNLRNSDKQTHDIIILIRDILLLCLRLVWAIGEALYRLMVPVDKKSVKGEIVLVTGAGHGIGKEVALQYASQGATVVCWDINEKNNQETVEEIHALEYTKAYAYVCNVANRSEVMELSKKVQREVGNITILINNAGIMPCHPFLDHTEEEIERIININVMGNFWTLQAILPKMIKNNYGHIVAISSCCGIRGMRNLVPYCASKFAVRGMMDALYQELKVDPNCQIKITTIYPYMVDTGLCKKPKIRFPNITPMLAPVDVAKHIITAQRRNAVESTVPRYLLSLFYYLKIFPIKVERLTDNFMDIYVESDLQKL